MGVDQYYSRDYSCGQLLLSQECAWEWTSIIVVTIVVNNSCFLKNVHCADDQFHIASQLVQSWCTLAV